MNVAKKIAKKVRSEMGDYKDWRIILFKNNLISFIGEFTLSESFRKNGDFRSHISEIFNKEFESIEIDLFDRDEDTEHFVLKFNSNGDYCECKDR